LKLVIYCTITNTPFDYVPFDILDTSRPEAPKGKYPYVRLRNGEIMGDSQFIIEQLEKERGAQALDSWLSEGQRMKAHVARRLMEESLYWCIEKETRWRVEDNFWNVTAPKYLAGQLPSAIACLTKFIGGMFRKEMMKLYWSQGMGRHTEDEVSLLSRDDVRSLDWLCCDCSPYFHGSQPSTIDAVLHAFVSLMKLNLEGYTCHPDGGEHTLASCKNLLAHYDHMERAYGKRINDACFKT